MAQIRQALLMLVLTGALCVSASGQTPRFFDDDPIQAMPAPLSLATARRRDVNHSVDFLLQSNRPDPRPAVRAGAVNTLGEVPDNEWFTNRHGLRRMSRDELQRGPGTVEGPVPPFTITGGKREGVMPGFTMEDSQGRRYFVKLDPMSNSEMATAAEVIVSKFLYAIGYNTPKNEIVNVNVSDLRLADSARIKLSDGRSRRMTWWDVKEIVRNVRHRPDESFRIVASLAIDGENIGPFRYEGIRPDDSNDTVPHDNRRDLRGLYVYAAWFNNTDVRVANTLDTIVEENGTRFIRHHLIDFGSALGSNGDRPKSARSGHKFVLPTPTEALRRVLTVGVPDRWERVSFPKLPAVGNFESQAFEPDAWKTNYPNPAFLSRLPDDDFWAAKQVMAFTDDDIRAIVETARFSDVRSAEYVIETLVRRRDKIGRTFFSRVLPLDDFRVENAELRFDDLSVKYGFHAPRRYAVRWSRFDNIGNNHDLIQDNGSTDLPAAIVQAAPGSYFCAIIDAPGDPLKRVSVYLRKHDNGYKVVAIDRLW